MSTTTKPTRTRAPKTVTYRTKSDHARALFAQGKTVAEVTKIVPDMGYAFAYGIAKRAGVNLTAANRRPTRAVSKDSDGSVTIQTTAGPVKVLPDGTVHRGRKVWKISA